MLLKNYESFKQKGRAISDPALDFLWIQINQFRGDYKERYGVGFRNRLLYPLKCQRGWRLQLAWHQASNPHQSEGCVLFLLFCLLHWIFRSHLIKDQNHLLKTGKTLSIRLTFFRGNSLKQWNLPLYLIAFAFRTGKFFLFILWNSYD